MSIAALLGIGLLAAGAGEYARPLDAGHLDQATLDAEGYGAKKALKREDEGLRITLEPGAEETGWKTPQALRIGGDFTITAEFVVNKLPKPAQEDGDAVGLAIATQSADQPELTLVRLVEPKGEEVYRSILKEGTGPQPPQPMMFNPFGGPVGKPPKPPRPTFPATGDTFTLELRREGNTVRFQVLDAASEQPRYLGQAEIGSNDLAAVKLFATNRNGAEAVDVLLRGLTIRADRLTGLGTVVRTVFGGVVYGDPTGIEDDKLVVGGPPRTPPAGASPPAGAQPTPAPATPATPPTAAAAVPAARLVVAQGNAVPAPGPAPAAVVAAAPVQPTAPAPAQAAAEPKNGDATPADAKPAEAAEPPKPRATIPLDEVESIHFERTPTLAARVLGQPNVDLTGPHPDAKTDEAKPEDKPKEGESRPADEAKEGPKDEASPPRDDDSEKPDAKHEADEASKKDDADEAEDEEKAKADDLLAPPPGTAAAEKVPRVQPKPNGIRDLHLILSNLRDAEIKQVTVSCQTDKGATSWRLDTSDSRDWPLAVRRWAREPWADLFLEPPPGDCHGKDFTINLTYADGQSANVNAKSDQHSDPRLAADPDADGPPMLDARVHLAGGDQLFGKLERIDGESLRLKTPWQDTLDVPLARVAGIRVGQPEPKETPEAFARRLESRGAEDLLLARTKDGEVVAIPGVAEGTVGDKLRFVYQEKSRTLPLSVVEGLILADRPAPKRPEGAVPTFALPGGVAISGMWKNLDASTWNIETLWGQPVKLPAAEVQSVRLRGGQLTYLSDLEPGEVEETPYFGHAFPWRRDANLRGEPLKIGGQTYEHGLAVHSRCVLTYDLDGQFATFAALVGFDDEARGLGRVACRVLADDRELYSNPDLRADAPPVPLELPVAGANRLRLVVDFGEGQDTGDRVVWADARLYRRPPPNDRADDPKPSPDAPR